MPFSMAGSEYKYDQNTYTVTDEMKKGYADNGYFFVRNMFSAEEMVKITKVCESEAITKHQYGVPDGEGRTSNLVMWSHPGNDVTGIMSRCERIVGTCEELMGGEVYHYHTKLMMKEPFTGGKHVWHQDYGYWYKNGCLSPDIVTAYIAIDKTNKDNGCLQILSGTQKCGRIDHVMVGGQTGADPERIKHIKQKYELKQAIMEPGDTLFFHSNLIHTADVNNSPHRRWVFLCAYNLRSNDPVYKHHHPNYTPLEKVPDSAIMECTNLTDMTGKEFLDPKMDQTIKNHVDKI